MKRTISIPKTSNYKDIESSVTQQNLNIAQDIDDGNKMLWSTGILYDRITPRIPILAPKGTDEYRVISCVGELLSPDKVKAAHAFVQKEWERIYDKFLKVDMVNRFKMKHLNLVFMSYVYLVLNSNYKKAYKEFELVNRAFDRAIDKKLLQEKYHSFVRLKNDIEKSKSYLDDEMHQDSQTQAVSKKCKEAILSFDKIATLDPNLHSEEIENCTRMFTECYVAISSLCLTKVEEGNMSINDAINFLNSIEAMIPIELSNRVLERRKMLIDAMPFYYLSDPQFIKERADNQKKLEFYEAKQLINDNLSIRLHRNDIFPTLIEGYRVLCRQLSHPNHVDAIFEGGQRSANPDHQKQLAIAKEPLLRAVEKTRELLQIIKQACITTPCPTCLV